MKSSIRNYILVFLKGMAMGLADIVPGISGGTVAFISGIYEDLISSISSFDFTLFKHLKKNGIKAVWKKINGNFLLSVSLGIFSSLIIFSNLIYWMIKTNPILVDSFFFGLVLSSIFYIFKKIKISRLSSLTIFFFGAILAYQITQLQFLSTSNNMILIFLSGVIAISAMLLPGISGALILLIMGSYDKILNSINEKEFLVLTIFGFGVLSGLFTFARFLKWLLNNYYNQTLLMLNGFMFGALAKLWPWRVPVNWIINENGEKLITSEKLVLPSKLGGDTQIIEASLIMISGFLIIISVYYFGKKNNAIRQQKR